MSERKMPIKNEEKIFAMNEKPEQPEKSYESGKAQTLQTEALFDEINKLIQNHGLQKALIHLRSVNNNGINIKNLEDINIYEYIINTVIQIFEITEGQLYKDSGKFVATDARQTAYVLIKKYLDYSQESIATQFGKSRSSVGMAFMRFDEMMNDESYRKIPQGKKYLMQHELADKLVSEFVVNIRKPA